MFKTRVIVIASASLGIILWWSLSGSEDPSLPIKNNSVESLSAPKINRSGVALEIYSSSTKAKSKIKPNNIEQAASEIPTESWDESAITQMREARLHGDDRAPPIARNEVKAEAPTPEELASPELYSDYETRQEMKLKIAYIDAAYPEMQHINQQLQDMRDAGLDEKSLREAEEKLTQLQAMTKRLQEQHPELASKKPATTLP